MQSFWDAAIEYVLPAKKCGICQQYMGMQRDIPQNTSTTLDTIIKNGTAQTK